MKQKVSPEIFRLEKFNHNWKLKYTENKKNETSSFFFKALEIKNFIKQFLKSHGLIFHNCKIAISSSTLNLFVLYHRFYKKKHSPKKKVYLNNNIAKKTKNKKLVNNIIKKLVTIYYTNIKNFLYYYKKKKLINYENKLIKKLITVQKYDNYFKYKKYKYNKLLKTRLIKNKKKIKKKLITTCRKKKKFYFSVKRKIKKSLHKYKKLTKNNYEKKQKNKMIKLKKLYFSVKREIKKHKKLLHKYKKLTNQRILKKSITYYSRKNKKFYFFLKRMQKHKKLLHTKLNNEKKQKKKLKNKTIKLIAYYNYTRKYKIFYIFLKRIHKYKKLLHKYKKLTKNNYEKKQKTKSILKKLITYRIKNKEFYIFLKLYKKKYRKLLHKYKKRGKKIKKKFENKLRKLKKLITKYRRLYYKKINKKFSVFLSLPLKIKKDIRLQNKNLSNKKRKYYTHIYHCQQADFKRMKKIKLLAFFEKARKILKPKSTKKLRRRLIYLKKTKEHSNLKKFEKNKKNLKANSFGNHFIESLRKFVGKGYSIYAMLKNLKIKSIKNKNIKKRRQFIKKKMNILLYKYNKTQFFEIGKQIAYITSKKKNSAQFLADFISSQLSKRSLKRRHYFFLKFIRTVLNLLVKKSVKSKIIGIKAIIRGRLNKARRSNRRTFKISIGKISLHKINLDINHAKAIAYTVDGTFGVEVCINHRKSFKIKKTKVKKIKTYMFLQPKKTKQFKKTRKGKIRNFTFKSNTLKFGVIGIKAISSGIISARQIEAARQAISRKTKRKGKIWIRIFPDLAVTAKSREARMGKGKGSISLWAARVRKGTVLFEICGIKENVASVALKLGGDRLPIKTLIFN